MTRKEVVESRRVPRIGPYSQAVVAGGLLFSIDAVAIVNRPVPGDG